MEKPFESLVRAHSRLALNQIPDLGFATKFFTLNNAYIYSHLKFPFFLLDKTG